MDLVELTKEIVVSLVQDKDSVNVKEFESDEDNTTLIQVMVAEDDFGRVIGKGGKTIEAIRTLVKASSFLQKNKKVKINVDKF